MSALGQKQTCAVQKGMSALPPKADMCSATRHVRFVPIADIASFFDLVGALQRRKKEIGKQTTRPLFSNATVRPCAWRLLRVSAMQAVDAGGPLRGWMPQQRCAVLLQIQR